MKCEATKKRRRLNNQQIHQITTEFFPTENEITNDSEIEDPSDPILEGYEVPKLSQWVDQENEIVGAGRFNNIIPKLFSVREEEKKRAFGAVVKKTFSIFKLEAANSEISGFNLSDLMASFAAVIEKLFKDVSADLSQDDKIQIILSEESGVMAQPISSKLVSVRNFDFHSFLLQTESYFQSERNISLNDGVRLEFVTVKMGLKGSKYGKGGKKKFKFISAAEALLKKKSCIQIVNDDFLCLPRCIAIGLAYKDILKVCKRQIRNSFRPLQKIEAQKLCEEAGVDCSDSGCDLSEIQKFEETFKISIKIFDVNAFLSIVYSGPINSDTKAVLYIARTDAENGEFHFDYISNITKFLGKKFFCDYCNFAYNAIHAHCCSDIDEWCFTCYNRNCKREISFEKEICETCKRSFKNAECKKRHLESSNSNCSFYKCFDCNKILKRKKKENGEWESNIDLILKHGSCNVQCSVCKENVDPEHICFMKKVPFKDPISKVVYFDFETESVSGIHIPVFCHVSWIFKENETVEKGQKSFGLSNDVSEEVGQFLFSPFFKGSTLIAHNARGFDGCFLMQYLVKNNLKPSNIILDGTKITYMTVPTLQIRLIDSLNLIPIPLAQFEKSFGLLDSGKGFFPYKFIRPENFDYIGVFPDKDAYGYDEMKPALRIEFSEWFESERNSVFNFRDEIAKYCIQDVNILQAGVEEFRNQIQKLTEIDEVEKDEKEESREKEEEFFQPILLGQFVDVGYEKVKKQDEEKKDVPKSCDPIAYCTLASLCHGIFKAQYLKENSIAQIPAGGYLHQKYSNRSIEWLEYLNYSENLKIVHQRNSSRGEIRINKFRVDGYDAESKTIYEFNGCFFHGHPACIDNMASINPVMKTSFECLLKRTLNKKRALQRQGYTVISKWECDWLKERESEEIKQFLKNHEISEPLCPKDAFFGGRVETFKLIDDQLELKKMYLDVNSLYPFVVSKKKFPVGHPKILIQNLGISLDPYFGYIKCEILPPKQLLIPVLPIRANGKLVFPLCYTCAQNQNTNFCTHSDSERKIKGTWFSEELKLAVENGYEIKKIFEIYHFEKQASNLFTEFMNKLYKIKLQASGKPTNIDFENFIKEMKDKEGIDLSDSHFEKNPGLRYIAKILLNSFWGRFALRENKPQFKFIFSLENLYKIIENESLNIRAVRPVKESLVGLVFDFQSDELVDISNNQNIYIAAATTSWARIELYKHLSKLSTSTKTQVLYCDTDSIIYNIDIEPKNQLTEGVFIGDLANELKQNEYITEFVSAGPKNYSYQTSQGNSCIKVKGFSLNFINQKAFKTENLKLIIKAHVRDNCDESGFVKILSNKTFLNQRENQREMFSKQHAENPEKSTAFFSEFAISVYNPQKITRNKDWDVLSIKEQKIFSFCFDKRIVKRDFSTIPFGYCESVI